MTDSVGGRVFGRPERTIGLVALGAVVLQAVAGTAWAAVHGFDLTRTTDIDLLVGRGAGTPGAFRLALLIDMLGYMALAPVVVHVYGRLSATVASASPPWLLRTATAAGLGFAIVGAIGAALLASFGPPLMVAAAAGGETAQSAGVAYTALSSGVYVGLWGPLNFLLLGIWAGTVGWYARGEGRMFAYAGLFVGISALAYAARIGLTGRSPTESGEPIDLVVSAALGMFVAWEAWLAIRLWRGR